MKKAIACVLFLGALMAGLALPVQKAGSGNWAAVKTKNDPGGRSECSMAAVNGKLYLFGGDGGEPQPVECFDPKTLTW